MKFLNSSPVSRLLAVICLILLSGCGPSPEERQADALLAKAKELSLAGGTFKERFRAHEHAEKLYREVITQYPRTKAAEAARIGLLQMQAIHEADRKLASEELAETYKASVKDLMQSVKPPR